MKLAKCQLVDGQAGSLARKEPFIQRNPDGSTEGRDPRKLPRELLETIHEPMPLSKVIRARCLDCCSYQQSEVARCTAVNCVSWPYRMGKNPFSNRTANPAALEALARARGASATENSLLAKGDFEEEDEEAAE